MWRRWGISGTSGLVTSWRTHGGHAPSQAALEALRALPFGPGEESVIVCNDWHTALLPVLIKVRALPSISCNAI